MFESNGKSTQNPTRAFQIEGIEYGSLSVRLAVSEQEIKAAQELRYKIFHLERATDSGLPVTSTHNPIDFDDYDAYCDHLLVIDRIREDMPCGVIGTYRLLRGDVAARSGGFYTNNEFDLSPLLEQGKRLIELGRACIDARYRRHHFIMNGMWRGIAQFITYYNIDTLFGCASFQGTDPEAHKVGLSFLHHYFQAPEELRVCALPKLYIPMDLVPPDEISMKQGLLALPSLLRSYLNFGGWVGEGAVIDRQFDVVDVFVVVCTQHAATNMKYMRRFRQDIAMAERKRAERAIASNEHG